MEIDNNALARTCYATYCEFKITDMLYIYDDIKFLIATVHEGGILEHWTVDIFLNKAPCPTDITIEMMPSPPAIWRYEINNQPPSFTFSFIFFPPCLMV